MQGKGPIIMGQDRQDQPASIASARKIPPRFWWTRRIALAWLLFVAAVIGSGLWWRYEADRRVRVELDAIAARGERLDGSRGPVKSLPPEQNAAEYYLRALEKLKPPQGIWKDDYRGTPMSLRAVKAGWIDEWLTANAQALAECRAARGAAGVEWRSASDDILLIEDSCLAIHPIALGNLLYLRAVRQAETGDSGASLQTLLDLDALTRALDQDPVAGNGSRLQQSLALVVEEISPHLKPPDAQVARSLITILLDDQPLDSARHMLRVARGKAYTRMQKTFWGGGIHDLLNPFGTVLRLPPWAQPRADWLIQPIILCEQARVLQWYDQSIQASRQVTKDRAERMVHMPDMQPGWLGLRERTHILGWVTLTYHLRMPPMEADPYSTLAVRRLAAGLLALRVFEMENGQPAQSLDELVPEYLPAVPIDPCDPAGGPIRAELTEAGPRLYSLGINGLDDGGTLPLPDPQDAPADLVLFLRQEDRLQTGWTLDSMLRILPVRVPAGAE